MMLEVYPSQSLLDGIQKYFCVTALYSYVADPMTMYSMHLTASFLVSVKEVNHLGAVILSQQSNDCDAPNY